MPEALGLNQALGYECQRRAWGRALPHRGAKHCAAVTKGEAAKARRRKIEVCPFWISFSSTLPSAAPGILGCDAVLSLE